nr:methyltransferase domain-containing protein [uncultured Albidiferax sp.]
MQTLSDITRQLLQRAHIQPAMRVLDIGCGSGEVTRAIASLVGPWGSVVGVDGSASALAAAKAATEVTNHRNIAYVLGDLGALELAAGSFDCIVGRRVLMYVPGPQGVIARLAGLLRTGGWMALQEHDATMTPGRVGHWPLHDQVHHWLWETVRREGANPHLGFSLAPMLGAVGLDVEAVWAQVVFAGYEQGVHHRLDEIVGFVQSRIVALGVATEAEIALPTLRRRLEAERQSHTSLYAADMAVCVVAQKRS